MLMVYQMLGRQWNLSCHSAATRPKCRSFRRTNIWVGAVFSRSCGLVRSWRSWRSEPFASKKKEADENIQMFLLELWELKNLIVGILWLLLLLRFGVWSLTKLPRSCWGFLASPRRAYAHRLVHLPAALGYIVDRHEISKKLRGGANSQQPKSEIKVHQQKQTVCFHHFSKKKLFYQTVGKKSLRVFVPKKLFWNDFNSWQSRWSSCEPVWKAPWTKGWGFDFRKHGMALVKVGSLAKRGEDFDFGGWTGNECLATL